MAEPARNSGVVVSLFDKPNDTAQLRLGIKPHQLELGLTNDRVITVVATETLHGIAFLRMLVELRPALILDLRIAPHFQFPAISNEDATAVITAIGSQYSMLSVPFHEIRHALLRHEPKQIAQSIWSRAGTPHEKIRGPVMVIVQHAEEGSAFGPYLHASIEQIQQQSWQLTFFQ